MGNVSKSAISNPPGPGPSFEIIYTAAITNSITDVYEGPSIRTDDSVEVGRESSVLHGHGPSGQPQSTWSMEGMASSWVKSRTFSRSRSRCSPRRTISITRLSDGRVLRPGRPFATRRGRIRSPKKPTEDCHYSREYRWECSECSRKRSLWPATVQVS